MSDAETRQGLGWIEGKDRRMEVLSEAPYVLASPLSVIAGKRITDRESLFVRNILDRAEAHTLDPQPIEGWEIELTGLIEPSRLVIGAEELLAMEQVEHEMVLECSGNGRAMYPGIPGTPWTQGGVGNVVFSGVPLSSVLERLGVAIDPQVRFVTAEGANGSTGGDGPDVEHSLPIEDVLDKSILALRLNGGLLPGIHGGPVRLVTPGFFGTNQIKWLQRLRFETAESPSFYHAVEYRVPLLPTAPHDDFRFTLENSRPTWHIPIMSYILEPELGARLPAGPVTVRGVAYNDGSARLESVLVSVDQGSSWQAASFDTPESPYAWYLWSTGVDLGPGSHEIWVRAIDQLGRSQPLDGNVHWNPNGYEWTGVFKAKVTVA